MIRKVFFGSNTANGFCSYYDFLRDDGKIFILKVDLDMVNPHS